MNIPRIPCAALAAVAAFVLSTSASAAELRVGTDPGEYATIQAAVNAASNGDVIVIEEGTYNEEVDLGNKRVTLESTDPDDADVVAGTIIDGQNTRNRCIDMNGGHITSTVIRGLTIRNARNHGIRCNSSSNPSAPLIEKCVIRDNGRQTGSLNGGGVAFFNGQMRYTTLLSNETGNNGGGVFTGGSAWIEHCEILGNIAENRGGGIAKGGLFDSNLILENRADFSGGGCANSAGDFINNLFASNIAEKHGGAAYNCNGALFAHNNFINNFADNGYGGAMRLVQGSTRIVNCVYSSNFALKGGQNTYQVNTRNHCAFDAGDVPSNGTGNIGLNDFGFVDVRLNIDPIDWDIHLESDSALIGAGDDLDLNDNDPVLHDYDDPSDTRSDWDIGCDEF